MSFIIGTLFSKLITSCLGESSCWWKILRYIFFILKMNKPIYLVDIKIDMKLDIRKKNTTIYFLGIYLSGCPERKGRTACQITQGLPK